MIDGGLNHHYPGDKSGSDEKEKFHTVLGQLLIEDHWAEENVRESNRELEERSKVIGFVKDLEDQPVLGEIN